MGTLKLPGYFWSAPSFHFGRSEKHAHTYVRDIITIFHRSGSCCIDQLRVVSPEDFNLIRIGIRLKVS